MPKLAIIIPALEGAASFEDGLVSVLQHRAADVEVVVVLTEPYADPYDLAEEVRFVQAPRDASFVACLRLGLAATEAPVVHFLGSGREVSEDWTACALRHFEHEQVAAVAPLTVRREAGAVSRTAGVRYFAGGVRRPQLYREQRRTPALGPELRAAFYRRAALEAVGGLHGQVGDELADVDLALALQAAGFQTVVEPAIEIEVPANEQAASKSFRQGVYAERLFWRNTVQRGWAVSLLAHAWVLAVAPFAVGLTAAAPHLLGRLLGGCQVLSNRSRRQALRHLRQNPPRLVAQEFEAEGGRRIDTAHRQATAPHARSADVVRRASQEL